VLAAFVLFKKSMNAVRGNSREAHGFRKKVFGVWVLISMCMFLSGEIQGAQSVSLAWNAPSNTTAAGYSIYYGNASSNYSSRIDARTNTAVTISGLKEGETYYFAVTAYNATGVESPPSDEISYIVPGLLVLTQGLTHSARVSMEFPVAPNHWYEVQASTDLESWTSIWQTPVETSNEWVQFSDPQANQFPMRFYRLVLH
jgi:hypothetical protein